MKCLRLRKILNGMTFKSPFLLRAMDVIPSDLNKYFYLSGRSLFNLVIGNLPINIINKELLRQNIRARVASIRQSHYQYQKLQFCYKKPLLELWDQCCKSYDKSKFMKEPLKGGRIQKILVKGLLLKGLITFYLGSALRWKVFPGQATITAKAQ